ncbi:Biotin-requiring enzyme [Poseidonocella pacifica]|uniref:Biotin-requiring enzyme n=1 Tax=Poseidonocella pacifica TaxID=871651 RepID=A0A1I0YD11_9RHOB|nr:biotin/lipoyl-containing protein [Poseidonocella pacifica]SFB10676.1 Biotin-requiring enzyme [Poseidonocella pacifica]
MFSEADMARLIEVMRQTATTHLTVEGAGEYLSLGLRPAGSASARAISSAPVKMIKSSALGVFIHCGGDDGLQKVEPGARISARQVLGYVSLDGARNPVRASEAGVLKSSTPEEGQIVGYGDVLFEMECDA